MTRDGKVEVEDVENNDLTSMKAQYQESIFWDAFTLLCISLKEGCFRVGISFLRLYSTSDLLFFFAVDHAISTLGSVFVARYTV